MSVCVSGCSSSKSKNVKRDNPREWKYFRILASVYDDDIFIKLQDELGVEPKMETFTITVNIKKDVPEPYVIFGDAESSGNIRFPWKKLSKEVQDGLINWYDSNKENLEN